ncbi:unnamed protein product [Amoebophrya sp. A25]|nr:unnamed protein product [Amoebophrya sp. A25]|eukprot:GSA25T00016710001.1
MSKSGLLMDSMTLSGPALAPIGLPLASKLAKAVAIAVASSLASPQWGPASQPWRADLATFFVCLSVS